MLRKTKIVATLGPAVDNLELMKELLRAGMNIARFNFSHGSHEEQKGRMEMLRQASTETGIPVALMLDTKGPEIRTGTVKDGGTITLIRDNRITLTTEEIEGDENLLSVSYQNLPHEVHSGGHIFVADGLVDLEVESVEDEQIHCIIRNGGIIGGGKKIKVPRVKKKMPPPYQKKILGI